MYISLIILPVLTLIAWTISNSMIKGLTSKMDTNLISTIIIGVGILPMLASIIIDPVSNIEPLVMILSGISGLMLGTGYILFYKSLKSADLGNAGVTLNIQQIVVIMFGLLILKEQITSLMLPGISLIIIGSVFVTVKRGFKVNKILIIASMANMIWGIYYIPLTFAILSLHASPVPLLLARITGFFAVILIFNIKPVISRSRSIKNVHETTHSRVAFAVLLSAVAAGMLDGTGNVLYALSIQYGIIIMAGAFIAMLPATLGLAGKFIYKEKLTLVQYSGILVSVLGALFIAVG
ncbi:MAG: EamA family transporter [Ferroplasma sp.]